MQLFIRKSATSLLSGEDLFLVHGGFVFRNHFVEGSFFDFMKWLGKENLNRFGYDDRLRAYRRTQFLNDE